MWPGLSVPCRLRVSLWKGYPEMGVAWVCDKEEPVRAQLLQLCLTLCNPMNCSQPGFSVRGILQARILEWVAMPSSQGILLTPGVEPGSPMSTALTGGFFTTSPTWEVLRRNYSASKTGKRHVLTRTVLVPLVSSLQQHREKTPGGKWPQELTAVLRQGGTQPRDCDKAFPVF